MHVACGVEAISMRDKGRIYGYALGTYWDR
jgi:hypothetical protein